MNFSQTVFSIPPSLAETPPETGLEHSITEVLVCALRLSVRDTSD